MHLTNRGQYILGFTFIVHIAYFTFEELNLDGASKSNIHDKNNLKLCSAHMTWIPKLKLTVGTLDSKHPALSG